MSHDPSQGDAHAAWRQTVESLANPDLELAASNAWSDHVVGAFADKNPGHAGFVLWDAVRQRICEGTADRWDVSQLRADRDILLAYLTNCGLYTRDHERLAGLLLEGAFAVTRCALAIAGAPLDFADSLREAIQAYSSCWQSNDLAVKSTPFALSPFTGLAPKEALLRIDEQFPAFQVVGHDQLDGAGAVQIARAMVRYALRWLCKDAQGPDDLDLSPEPGEADCRWTTIALVAETAGRSWGVLGMLSLNRQGWPNPAGAFFPDPVTLGITVLDDDWRRGFNSSYVAGWRYALSIKPSLGPSDVCWRVGPLPPHRDRSDNRSYRRPLVLEGASASGAAAWGLAALHCDWRMDHICFTGKIDEAGIAYDILGKTSKLRSVAGPIGKSVDHSTVQTLLVGGTGLSLEDRDWWIAFAGQHNCGVSFANNLEQVYNLGSKLPERFDEYLRSLVAVPERNSGQPTYMAGKSLAQLYVEPAVLKFVPVKKAVIADGSQESRQDGSQRDVEPVEPVEVQEIGEDDHRDGRRRIEQKLQWTEELRTLVAGEIRCIVVKGPPGQGKTLMATMSVKVMAERARHEIGTQAKGLADISLPLYLSLEALVKVSAGPAVTTDKQLRQALRKTLVDGHTPVVIADYLAEHAHEERCWLFLDCLDQVTDHAQLHFFLEVLKDWDSKMVILTRPWGFDSVRLPFRAEECRLAPFSPEQVQTFVNAWGESHKQQTEDFLRRPEVSDLAQNPFLLTLLCWVAKRRPDLRERLTRSQVYDRVLRDLLGQRRDAPAIIDEERADLWMALLEEIALALLRDDVQQSLISSKRLQSLLRDCEDRPPTLVDDPQASVPERVSRLLKELGEKRFLIPSHADRSTYEVPHRSFLEFLAGKKLASLLDDSEAAGGCTTTRAHFAWGLIDNITWDPHWEQVIVFAAEMVQPSSRNRLLDLLTDSAHNDFHQHCSQLAHRCGRDGSAPRMPIPRPVGEFLQFSRWPSSSRFDLKTKVDLTPTQSVPVNVLCVDDILLPFYRALLSHRYPNLTVRYATCNREAMPILSSGFVPDLVLMDMIRADSITGRITDEGTPLGSALRDTYAHPDVFILAISGNSHMFQEKWVSAGLDMLLDKPIYPALIIWIIDQLLNYHTQLQDQGVHLKLRSEEDGNIDSNMPCAHFSKYLPGTAHTEFASERRAALTDLVKVVSSPNPPPWALHQLAGLLKDCNLIVRLAAMKAVCHAVQANPHCPGLMYGLLRDDFADFDPVTRYARSCYMRELVCKYEFRFFVETDRLGIATIRAIRKAVNWRDAITWLNTDS